MRDLLADPLFVGALYSEGASAFRLYAPGAGQAHLVLPDRDGERRALDARGHGYWSATYTDLPAGTRYRFVTDRMREPRPDPASRWQPLGVHGHSVLVDAEVFTHTAAGEPRSSVEWAGRELRDMIIYELHVGTFSEAGTFAGAAEHLLDLVRLGVNTVELMPVNQFPGARNWGYDGVYWQAVQDSYGGPEGLVAFVDAAHACGLAVIVDAVFNHLGPEGNYLPEFGPYLTDKHHTPWGPAVNLDDYGSDGVRDFIRACAKTYLVDYGVDGLRLDAVHALRDSSAVHILEKLSTDAKAYAKTCRQPRTLIGECDLNDPRYVTSVRSGGLGLRGQWCDEFHHALRARLTGERRGYYADFGDDALLLRALEDGYVFTGQFSQHRGRRFGRSTAGLSNHQLVVFGQNHDQVGNRAVGERLHRHLNDAAYLLQAAIYLWSPFTPMLWMGEEYAERAPFPYFVDHGDPAVLKATREGRMREFAPFVADGEQVPDPGEASTFASAKLSHERSGRVYKFYREALAVRRRYWPLRNSDITAHKVGRVAEGVIAWRMTLSDGKELKVIANLSPLGFALQQLAPSWAVKPGKLVGHTQPVKSVLPAESAAVWLCPSS